MSTTLSPDSVGRLSDVVHVSYALQPAVSPVESLKLLSADELTRWERYRFPKDRDRFLWSRLLLRFTLSEYYGVPPQAWEFAKSKHGKPEISQPAAARNWRFNLSHTEGIAVVAVAWNRDIGVDVEHSSRPVSKQLVDFALAPKERVDWEECPEDRRSELFLSYWTLKEAYLKARGLGLSVPLRSFAFQVRDDDNRAILAVRPSCDDVAGWSFLRHRPTAEHLLAIAVPSESDHPTRLDVRPSALMAC